MQALNSEMLKQTLYFALYARKLAVGIDGRLTRKNKAAHLVQGIFGQGRIPAVVRIASYLELNRSDLPVRTDDEFELLLSNDAEDSEFYRRQLLGDYRRVRRLAFESSRGFSDVRPSDFKQFGEKFASELATASVDRVPEMVPELDGLIASMRGYLTVQELQ